MPELMPGSGQFPSSKARIVEDGKDYYFEDMKAPCLNDYEKSFAILRISLVMQTLTALERSGLKKGCEVYTEGGFRKDDCYSRLLASALVNNKVFLTDINEASALGAAMTAKMAISGKSLNELSEDFDISYHEQEKYPFPELEAYRLAWLAEAEK
jgi:sugar (pentulose or hexulose) kinase